MIKVAGNTNLTCVVSDTFVVWLRAKYGSDKVAKVEFLCGELGVSEEFTWEDRTLMNGEDASGYSLKIPSEVTSLWEPCITDYSIRITFVDGTVRTILYRESLKILKEANP